jgi:energy-coupling factor transporter ATP-binding protein EcfA2
MKVRRLTKVTGYGVLDGFEWPADLAQFEERNLVYGWNGSGKTTLSRMLRELETHRPSGQPAGFELLTDAGIVRRDDALNQGPSWVRVFNEDFVAESVFTQSGELPPVLYIGKQSVEAQRQLEALRSARKRLEPELTAAGRAVTDAESALDRFRIAQGKTIKDVLRSGGRNPYNDYDKSAFGSRAAALRALPEMPGGLSDDERDELRAIKCVSAACFGRGATRRGAATGVSSAPRRDPGPIHRLRAHPQAHRRSGGGIVGRDGTSPAPGTPCSGVPVL